jgi:hypothetical protein
MSAEKVSEIMALKLLEVTGVAAHITLSGPYVKIKDTL